MQGLALHWDYCSEAGDMTECSLTAEQQSPLLELSRNPRVLSSYLLFISLATFDSSVFLPWQLCQGEVLDRKLPYTEPDHWST